LLLKPDHLPRKYLSDTDATEEYIPDNIKSLKEAVERYELNLIRTAVSNARTLEEAAHKLGISLSTLTRRLRLLKLDSHK